MDVLTPVEVAGLQPWIDAGVLGPVEVHVTAVAAGQLVAQTGALWPDERVVLAYALAVWAPLHGHACIHIDSIAGVVATELAIAHSDDDSQGAETAAPTLPWPEPRAWSRALRGCPAVRVVTDADTTPHLDDRPLVLCDARLYTQRQWVDECIVATALDRLAGGKSVSAPPASRALLDRLLPAPASGVNSQHAAAMAGLTSQLSVIVGGPGSGKTHTIACLLAALITGALEAETPIPRIGLAAPTGKAAGRMTEAIATVGRQSPVDEELPAAVADGLVGLSAVTVHRLLGPRPEHRSRFVHDHGTPLPYDVIVVDETSMLPLPLMARLLEAVPINCRLVLVGDPDQLESIEVGAVLGDIVRSADRPGSALRPHVLRLTSQHRTGISSPIGPLADAIRSGRADSVLAELRRDVNPLLSFVEVDTLESPTALAAVRDAVASAFEGARDAAERGDAAAALGAAASARILCAHRHGPAGAAVWNRHVETWLHDGAPRNPRAYAGRIILATRNDARTGVVNGDAGVLVGAVAPDGADGALGVLRAVFRRGDAFRDFSPAELDDLDTAFAMTVHKSQGSEYDTVVVIHPPADSPLIGRELLYTAVTRASRRLVIVGSPESIRRAVENPTRRVTGLTAALR